MFVSLKKGPFDDQLKWPFRGQITLQIVNQAGDHSHVEEVIDESIAGRVRDVSSIGQGHVTFLPH
jgi:hypothetical protein